MPLSISEKSHSTLHYHYNMSQQFKNVIVIGAGGNVGPHVVTALDNAHDFNISILSREGSKSTFAAHFKVFTTPDSYPEEALLKAFKGQDVIVDLAPQHQLDQRKSCIDAAIKAGVKRYIPGEFGSNTEVPEVNAAVPLFQSKLDVQHYLKSKEKEGLTWTGVLNGPFFDWGLRLGILGFDLKEKKALIYDGGNNYTDMTILPTVGKAVVGVLRHPEETVNRYVHVNSYYTTQNQILAALEKATGTKWAVEHTTCKEQGAKGKELLAKHDFSGVGPAIFAMEYSGADFLNFEKFGLSNAKFGLPKTNSGMEEEVKNIVEEGKAS